MSLCCRVAVPGYMGNLPAHVNSWERFGVEFCLTFIVVFTYFVSMDTYRKWLGSSPLVIGAAYLACTLVTVSKYLSIPEFRRGGWRKIHNEQLHGLYALLASYFLSRS
jgi:hypothetical protein